MLLRSVALFGLFAMLLITVQGCSSSGTGLFNKKAGLMSKGDQWEPETDGPKTDWRGDAGKIGRGNRRAEREDPLDKLLWSEQARDINRNTGFN